MSDVAIPDGWQQVKLGDVLDITHGFAFSGDFITDKECEKVLVTPGNFEIGGGFKASKFKYYTGQVPAEYVLQPGDLVVSMTDLSKAADTLGYSALVPQFSGVTFLHNQRIGKVVLHATDIANIGYIHYLLRCKTYRNEVLASATGTTVRHTSPSRIRNYRFLLPPIHEQKAIAHILGTLDDKIDQLRKTNSVLEDMASALFKSWFVDFDPVKSKQENRLTGLPKDLDDLFPDSFEDSALGPIPTGWRVVGLGDLVEVLSGGTPSTSIASYWGGNIPWFSVKDTPALSDVWVIETEKHITHEGLANSAAKILPPKTTIISARGTVGKLALTSVDMAMNQSCYGLRNKNGRDHLFVYFTVRTLINALQQSSHGTVFDTITRQTIDGLNCIVCGASESSAFESAVTPKLSKMLSNIHQIRTLTNLRDTLLPKLISGDLRVPEAEQMVTELGL